MGERTVALQGKILSTNTNGYHTNIIVISAHMSGNRSACTENQRLELTEKIIAAAQKFANNKNFPVILCGDWNCPVNEIDLPVGALS